MFNNASEKAYGSVIYRRSIYKSGKISTNLVVSKSNIAPLHAVLGMRVAKMLADAFQLSMDVVIFWCNRMNVLWWIQGRNRRFNQFSQ